MGSRTVFRKLEKALDYVIEEQLDIEEEIKNHQPVDKGRIELVKQKKDLLDEINRYKNSYGWLTHKETVERIKFFLRSGHNYSEYIKRYYYDEYGMSEAVFRESYIKKYDEVCKKEYISFEDYIKNFNNEYIEYEEKCEKVYNTAKVSISYANQKLIDKVGRNTIELILEGRIEEARATFYFRTGQLKLRNFILDSALAEVPDAEYMTINIDECEKELLFLRYYSQTLLEARAEDLDKDKLAYLRYIIEGDNPKLSETRLIILETIKGKMKVKDCIEQINEKNIY